MLDTGVLVGFGMGLRQKIAHYTDTNFLTRQRLEEIIET